MGNPRQQWKLDDTAADKGVDLVYDGYSIRVLPALETNPKYTAKLRSVMQKFRSRMKTSRLSKEEDDKVMAEVYADAIIVGWTNVTDENGRKIQFTKDNVISLLLDVPLLFSSIREQAEEFALFQADQTEKTVKN